MPANTSPAASGAAITVHDTNQIEPTRGIYVAASGDLKVKMLLGDELTFVDIAAGIIHPLQVVQVFDTGTTATGIIALR